MIQLLNPLFLIPFSVFLLFNLEVYLLKKRPPSFGKALYAYRSHQALQSKKNWDIAQMLACKEIYCKLRMLIIIALIGYFWNPIPSVGISLSLIIVAITILQIRTSTEKKLKKITRGN